MIRGKRKAILCHLSKPNRTRARRAAIALTAFGKAARSEVEHVVCDLLVDLMHWCDGHGQDFDTELRRARVHYESESMENDR